MMIPFFKRCDIMAKYVLTGGPSSGKTTLAEYIFRLGHNMIPETAELIIDEQLKQGGDMVPWNEARRPEFQEELIRRQIEAERGINGSGIHFLDRAIPDNIAYNLYDGNKPSDYLLKSSRNGGYDCVFLLEQLPFYENTDIRRETAKEAMRLSFLLSDAYGSLGYEVVRVAPLGSAEMRAEFIMDFIKDK